MGSSFGRIGDRLVATHFKSLPKLSKDFLKKYVEKYNKREAITDVLVEYSYTINKSMGHFHQYREYSLKLSSQNEITIHPVKQSWTREEVLELLKTYGSICEYMGKEVMKNLPHPLSEEELNIPNKWIEENL